MEKKKILFITPSLCQGGIEHYQITMLKLLDKEKFDITLFLYLEDITLLPLVPEHVRVIIDKDTNHYFRRPKAVGLRIMKKVFSFCGQKGLADKYSELLRQYVHKEKMKHPAKEIFMKERFDVVVSNAIGKATEMAIHINAKRRIVFFHSSVDVHHNLLEKLFPKFDVIVAVSDGVRSMLQEAYPKVKEKVVLLENYVDANEIMAKACVNEKIEICNNNVKIASCGRLSQEKGFDMAIKVAALIKEKGIQFYWTFIGDGDERKNIENLIQQYSLENIISITGYTDNPFPMIKNCDIYVQPSYEESYGRTIKEAMILGCPVISTSTVGGKTLIKDGVTGVLTDINEVALAEGIISLIENQDLCSRLKNVYSMEQNLRERQVFIEKLEQLLM